MASERIRVLHCFTDSIRPVEQRRAECFNPRLRSPATASVRPIEPSGDLGEGAALPVVQDQGLALGTGKPGQRIRQQNGLLVPHGLLAGCRLLRRPATLPGRPTRLPVRPRAIALGRSRASAVPAPGSHPPCFGPGSSAATLHAPRRLGPGIGRASDRPREASAARDPKDRSAAPRGAQLHPGQDVQVIAEPFETRGIGKIRWFHLGSPAILSLYALGRTSRVPKLHLRSSLRSAGGSRPFTPRPCPFQRSTHTWF